METKKNWVIFNYSKEKSEKEKWNLCMLLYFYIIYGQQCNVLWNVNDYDDDDGLTTMPKWPRISSMNCRKYKSLVMFCKCARMFYDLFLFLLYSFTTTIKVECMCNSYISEAHSVRAHTASRFSSDVFRISYELRMSESLKCICTLRELHEEK